MQLMKKWFIFSLILMIPVVGQEQKEKAKIKITQEEK